MLNNFIANAVEYESWKGPALLDYVIAALRWLGNLCLITGIFATGIITSLGVCVLGLVMLYAHIIKGVLWNE